MKISLTPKHGIFSTADTVAGCYVLDDPFKPYLHPLRTPAGHTVTNCMPADHRHHKGLMYGLRCADLNFWEEYPGTSHCGVQRSKFIEACETSEGTGLRQHLRWEHESGGRPTYDEQREIVCRHVPDQSAFVWTWRSLRTALRDHRLVKSDFSFAIEDGRKINYHGLGIRLPWMWSFPADTLNGAERDGQLAPWKDVCGTSGPEVGFWGLIDGHWTPPIAAVTIRQHHGFGWFVLKGAFSYVSVGPSCLEERDVRTGETFSETYQIIVQDRKPTSPAP